MPENKKYSVEQLSVMLNAAQKEVQDAQKSLSQLEGRLEALKEQMEKEFGITDIEEGEKLLAKMDKELEKKEAAFETGVLELKQFLDSLKVE